jgi:hypothetical protein
MVGLKPSLQILKGEGVRKRGLTYCNEKVYSCTQDLGSFGFFTTSLGPPNTI